MPICLFEKKISERLWLSAHVGLLEGFGFSVASNALLIHPTPFVTIILEK